MKIDNIISLLGGEEGITRLVDIFYSKIDTDEILRPMFPKSLENGKRWQSLFLIQRFGGEPNYQKERGSPMLRKRHMPFTIGVRESNRWLELMYQSLDEFGITKEQEIRSELNIFFELTAIKMINKRELKL